MISLQGLLTATELQNVRDKTKLIFADSSLFQTAESVVVHEQNMLSDEQLLQACSDEYGVKLFTPRREYIPRAVLDKVKGMNVVPISYNAAAGVMDVGIIPDLQPKARSVGTVTFKFVKVPIYYYVDMYTDYYGRPDFIMELPAKDYLDFIFSEAVS